MTSRKPKIILTNDLDELGQGLPALEVCPEVLHRVQSRPLPQLTVDPGDVGLKPGIFRGSLNYL